MTRNWTRVAMKGKAQVIPATCPNCLGAAERKYRYGYKGIEGWLTRTTYYQTFSYCERCHPQAISAAGLRRWGIFAGIFAFFAWIPLLIALTDAARDPVTGLATGLRGDLAIAASVALALCAGGVIYGAARGLKHRRYPKRPEQAIWGLAVFYTGGMHLGFNTSYAVYKAVRPEWIVQLLKANPEQVEEAVYQNLVGEARPSLVPAARPFGPA
jgi:hypothetical protein